MNKLLVFAFSALCFGSVSHAESLAVETTPASERVSVKAKIVKLINREVAKPGTPLNVAVEAIKRENDIPVTGTLGKVTQKNIFLLSHGRAGGGIFGQQYLVGLPVSWQGTGMIEEYIAYLDVGASLYLEERDTIRVEKFVEISDKK